MRALKVLGIIGALIIGILGVLLCIGCVVLLPSMTMALYSMLLVYLGGWTIPVMAGGFLLIILFTLGAFYLEGMFGE
jgi:hypothetical protein